MIVYSGSMSCFQAIGGEDTENLFINHITNRLWLLSEKGPVFVSAGYQANLTLREMQEWAD